MEDLLDSEIGKHDYDWLLTPPGTPRVPALEVAERTPSSNILPKRTTTRSSSTTRASRLSVSQTENGHSTVPTRPARSNSVCRPSIQSTLMSSNSRTTVLNSSISSVSSRPTTPSKRTSTLTATKPSLPASRPVPTRSSTPVKTRPSTPAKTRPSTPAKTRPSTPVKTRQSVSNSMTDSAAVKVTSAQNSRPSTPTSRSRIMSNSSSSTIPAVSRPSSSSSTIPAVSRPSSSSSTIPAAIRPSSSSSNIPGASRASSSLSSIPTISRETLSSSSAVPSVSRSSSRSSTPTRQPIMHSSAPAIGCSPSVGRISTSSLTSIARPAASSGRNSAPSSAPSSRPSSPNPRPRAPVRPLDIPDFPNETPPNLRTKLPERPLSTGRVRPGIALGVRSTPNSEPIAPSAPVKKMSVPAVSRSKFSDAPSKVSTFTNGHQNRQTERSVLDGQPTRPARSVTGIDNGFGRTISKKSLDMAIRHMDIRQNLGGIRAASLFPHSIRSTAAKVQPVRMSGPGGHPVSNGGRQYTENGGIYGHFSGDSNGALSHNGGSSTTSPDRGSIGTKDTMNEVDIYGSSRYESMLLREDARNMSWLHSLDDKSDQSPVFDHRFEPLPEPFSPL